MIGHEPERSDGDLGLRLRARLAELESASARAAAALVDPKAAGAHHYRALPRLRVWAVVVLVIASGVSVLVIRMARATVRENQLHVRLAQRRRVVEQKHAASIAKAAAVLREQLPRQRKRLPALQHYVPEPSPPLQPTTRPPRVEALAARLTAKRDPAWLARRPAARASIAAIAACVANEPRLADAIRRELGRLHAQLSERAKTQLLGQVARDEARDELRRVDEACKLAAAHRAAAAKRRDAAR